MSVGNITMRLYRSLAGSEIMSQLFIEQRHIKIENGHPGLSYAISLDL